MEIIFALNALSANIKIYNCASYQLYYKDKDDDTILS